MVTRMILDHKFQVRALVPQPIKTDKERRQEKGAEVVSGAQKEALAGWIVQQGGMIKPSNAGKIS